MEIKDFIGIGIAGILSFLFFDIRSIRQNKDGYLTEDKHELLCENAALRLEKKIDNMKSEVLEAIKDNHK